MTTFEIEQFLKKKNESFPQDLIQTIEKTRVNAAVTGDEKKARHYWFLAMVYYTQSSYINFYHLLKQKRYEEAWQIFKQIDMQLTVMEQNFHMENDPDDPYHMVFIADIIHEFEKLFPYEYFICRETVVTKWRCSICGEIVRLRGGCTHVPGRLYDGELCVHDMEDMRYLDMKLAHDPFSKIRYLDPYKSDQLNLNFGMLDTLMPSLRSPYDYWEVEITKEKNPQFARIGRNDKCPCGSGKKFKHCCMNDETRMMFDHYKIKMLNEPGVNVDTPLKML